MIEPLKNLLFFPLASYFRFFAGIRLRRWGPKVVVVTGSNGKTTLLHMLEAQLGKHAAFSHHANSSFGIPFFVLDLHRTSLKKSEWITLFLKAPIQAFSRVPSERIVVIEADTDRAGEGKFLAEFLRPEVVLWVSVGRTHGVNFDGQVRQKKFATVDEAIAYDYGYFLEYCKGLAVIDGDSHLETVQISRTAAEIFSIKKKDYLQKYHITKEHTRFVIKDEEYVFKALLPEELFYSIAMCRKAVEYLGYDFDPEFKNFTLPPGRSSLFEGKNGVTIVDSSYNANLASMTVMLTMFDKMPGSEKWVVLGDMLELGEKEREEHEKLGDLVAGMDFERVILVGKRVAVYTYAVIQNRREKVIVEKFEKLGETWRYLENNLRGGEMVLFKGSQSIFLEALIELLLVHKKDADSLPRRGEFWDAKRSAKMTSSS